MFRSCLAAALLPLRTLAGDPRAALSRPDGLVITPQISRKYFGTERALGAMLLIDEVPMHVEAIVETPPPHRSILEFGLFASALAEQSAIPRDGSRGHGGRGCQALGASRGALVVQSLGEAMLYVLAATLLAAMATELLLPHVNAFLETGAALGLFSDPAMLGWIVHGLAAWPFVAATALTLAVALLTVSIHCHSVASEKPVRALRYE